MLARRASAFGLQISSLACRFASVSSAKLGCESLFQAYPLTSLFASDFSAKLASRAGASAPYSLAVSLHICLLGPCHRA
ncbi:hypothetical protein TC41_0277 [Alicyclobacillus acidocaldarius subsp. acidocaldarius Tc-4-1]|uniref:Uncharacterized protein n=1 Tax=Alicyclobacillus acidocaldarius (strain Tc-4-1) TaxID=1048834 RepID=F8IJR0_ALIAT|nr:hypothetical protein TC41_0277 [Alicyclobacillus acidocaldarius subsp. acidocaldarius Tc-4-1]